MKYTSYEYDLGRFNIDNYNYVKLPYEASGKIKVLFVLDHMPKEDMECGRLLSGVTGDLLNSLISHTKRMYAKQASSFSWLACTFNAFKSYGKSAEFRATAEAAFADRVHNLICKYQPDYVVPFGASAMRAVLPAKKLVENEHGRVRYSYWLGVPIRRRIKFGGMEHSTTIVSNISLNDIIQGDGGEASLLGYMCKCLAPIFGKTYLVDSEEILADGATFIDTFKKFERLMDTLAEKEYIAVDTETKNLNKVTNQLLTVQFAYSQRRGFVVPMSHKDSPFRPNEVTMMQQRLKEYFEGANNNKYHVYTNAKFDLTQFRSACNVEYFANPLWDILGGEFTLDENLKSLDLVLGEYYYSLGNLAVQYGYEGYLTADFSKQHRANFSSADLNDPAVINYCAMDTCVPIAIHQQQKLRAKDQGYVGFKNGAYGCRTRC